MIVSPHVQCILQNRFSTHKIYEKVSESSSQSRVRARSYRFSKKHRKSTHNERVFVFDLFYSVGAKYRYSHFWEGREGSVYVVEGVFRERVRFFKTPRLSMWPPQEQNNASLGRKKRSGCGGWFSRWFR